MYILFYRSLLVVGLYLSICVYLRLLLSLSIYSLLLSASVYVCLSPSSSIFGYLCLFLCLYLSLSIFVYILCVGVCLSVCLFFSFISLQTDLSSSEIEGEAFSDNSVKKSIHQSISTQTISCLITFIGFNSLATYPHVHVNDVIHVCLQKHMCAYKPAHTCTLI